MLATLRDAARRGDMRVSGRGLALSLTILVATPAGCGRIPGLYDAARPATHGEPADGRKGQYGDSGPITADAAFDLRRSNDVAGGTGGTGGTTRDLGQGGASGLGGAGGGPRSTLGCDGPVAHTASRQPADVLLVLDRSGSMSFNIDQECSCDPDANPKSVCADTTTCQTRWSSLVSALDSAMASTPFLQWGLKLFSSPNLGPCEVGSGVEVPISAGSTAAIAAQIRTISPAGETPTAFAIGAATAYLETLSDSNPKMILLATDGKPNCGGVPPSVYEDDVPGTTDAITAAAKAGFLVYVMGIGRGVSLANLDGFARAGGTGRHYLAQSAEQLAQALAAISKAARCAFTLTALPPDPDDVAVYLDKAMVPREASNGWSFGATAGTILLRGDYCEQALANPTDAVQVLFTCGRPSPMLLP